MVIVNRLYADQNPSLVMNFNCAKVAFWSNYMVRSFKTAIWTVETYVPEFLVVPKPEDFFSALRAAIACALSQCGIVNTCPFQVQSFMRRIMLNVGKLNPAMFPCSSPLVLRDGKHQPESYAYD
jgi:hypothetical protein